MGILTCQKEWNALRSVESERGSVGDEILGELIGSVRGGFGKWRE